ncbi:PadR family transcriptional regulator [Parasphingopyxis algicola]|uniref:PadR family transcriptional regulator n=1 Tax=Parasphingopyxis algicola TaxID=2026624 RepID=UPI00159FE2D4|nr:PadR family transcriptional regulator [Parasphingopyxis algicola]QLC24753.1 PadR family transcriptional regulator [Parasphingopyxis algicola]
MSKSQETQTLSEHEGALLDVVRRNQPVTGYQIAQIYGKNPVAAFNKSKGQIYPMIRRFNKAGLIEGSFVEGDGRGTEIWSCTEKGLEALRIWSQQILDSHLLLDDPLRTRMMAFDLLTEEERFAWIVEAKAKIAEKLEQVEAFNNQVDVPFQRFVHDNAISSLRMRMDWLDRLLFAHTRSGTANEPD